MGSMTHDLFSWHEPVDQNFKLKPHLVGIWYKIPLFLDFSMIYAKDMFSDLVIYFGQKLEKFVHLQSLGFNNFFVSLNMKLLKMKHLNPLPQEFFRLDQSCVFMTDSSHLFLQIIHVVKRSAVIVLGRTVISQSLQSWVNDWVLETLCSKQGTSSYFLISIFGRCYKLVTALVQILQKYSRVLYDMQAILKWWTLPR
jgi:hypothetical protein